MAERGRSKRGDETVTAELEWHRSRAPPYRSKSNHIRAELCGSLVVLCRSRLYRYFFLVTSGSAQTLASCHPTSVIFERFKCASDLGGVAVFALAGRHTCPGRRCSTPCGSGLFAAIFAHSSAFSFPGTPLRAGRQRNSIVTLGLLLRMVAICLLALSAYLCPGPGSSEPILRMAA